MPLAAEAFGGGDVGWEAAAIILETQNDLPEGTFSRKNRPKMEASSPVKPSQGESRSETP